MSLNAADFGDLLLLHDGIQTRPGAGGYQRQFHYILVDEYEFERVTQYLWLRLLAQGRNNMHCVARR